MLDKRVELLVAVEESDYSLIKVKNLNEIDNEINDDMLVFKIDSSKLYSFSFSMQALPRMRNLKIP